MDRQHLYQIPGSIEKSPYLLWYVDPQLRRYIDKRILDDCSPSSGAGLQVLKIAQKLVEEVQQLPLEREKYTYTEKSQSGAITALIAYSLFGVKERTGKNLLIRKIRLNREMENLERYFQGTDLKDIYQVSLVIISNSAKFVRNFRFEPDWYVSFCGYSYEKLSKSLADELRLLAGVGFKRTNLGLLYRTCPSTLANLLQRSESNQARRDRSLLLHKCFQETVKAKTFITKDPQPTHYDALFDRYRERKQEQGLDLGDRDETKALLTDLGNMVRNYHHPTGGALPLDAPASTTDVTFGEMQADPREGVSLEDRERRELALAPLRRNFPVDLGGRSEQFELTKLDRKLDKARLTDLILFLLDGLGLTQMEVGEEFERHFASIGKRRTNEIARLAKELYFRNEHQTPTKDVSAEILARYMSYVEPLCVDYYAEMALDLLERVIESTTESSIVDRFVEEIEAHWRFRFKPEGGGLAKVYAFVQRQQQHGNWDDESKIHEDLRLKRK
jgi:hypothetical protein